MSVQRVFDFTDDARFHSYTYDDKLAPILHCCVKMATIKITPRGNHYVGLRVATFNDSFRTSTYRDYRVRSEDGSRSMRGKNTREDGRKVDGISVYDKRFLYTVNHNVLFLLPHHEGRIKTRAEDQPHVEQCVS